MGAPINPSTPHSAPRHCHTYTRFPRADKVFGSVPVKLRPVRERLLQDWHKGDDHTRVKFKFYQEYLQLHAQDTT